MEGITEDEVTKQAKSFSDSSCQTHTMPRLPLPTQYPANLIFAQNMLAISLSQLQTVDLTIAQLRFHLREQQLRAATNVLLSNQAGLGLSSVPIAVAQAVEATETPEADAGAAPAAGAEAEAAAAGAAEGGAGAPLEHLWAHRRRLAAAVKIAFVMVLLEVRTGWFFVYFFVVFLYIGGIFDPIIEWFQRRPAQVTLEQQLAQLRNRQREPERPPTAAAVAAEAVGGAAAEGASSSASTATRSPGEAGDGSSSSADGAAAGASGASGSDGAGGGLLANAAEGEAGGADDSAAAAAPPAEQLPYWHRFTYQLVVMFFMTLLPWWNPDPRYL